MRTVVPVEEGVVEVNWLWLPTFIGMNSILKGELEKELAEQIKGRQLNELTLDFAHVLVVEFLRKKFPTIKGLTEFFDGLKYVYYE